MNAVVSAMDVESVICPVCGPAPTRVWMEDGKPTRYVRCKSCGTVYASPREAHARRYAWLDSTFGMGPNAFQNADGRRPALAREASILQQYMAGGRLLDVGCDTGLLFEWFSEPAWQRCGVEISPSAAAYAAQHYHAEVFAGTITQAMYPDASFDLVTMIDMLYYVDDPRADFNEVARILKPNGLLAVEITGQAYQLMRSRGLLTLVIDHHWTRLRTDSAYLFWFSPTGLKRLLEQSGFRVVDWHIVPSPERSGRVSQLISNTYYRTTDWLAKRSSRALSIVPKYLCIARLQ